MVIPLRSNRRPPVAGPVTTHPDDGTARLVDRAIAGDVDAFEALYRQTVGRVHGLWF